MKHIYLLLLILLNTLFISACSNDDTKNAKNRDAVIVHTEDVIVGEMPIHLHAVGSVKADRTVHIQSRAPGELLEILVHDGDIVNEGQVLFKIDKAPLEVAFTSANASYQSNRAQLKKAKDDLARIVQLSKNGFASADQLEQAQIRVDMFSAALKADQANVKNARLNLSYADIKAPIQGKIGSINSDVGNYISPGQPILTTLEDTNHVRIDFAIPEKELIPLRESYKRGNVPVRATTSSGLEVEGLLTFLGNVNTSTGTILVTAKFENPNNDLWVGQFVDVRITTDILQDVHIVSEKSVILGPNGLFVYVVNDGIAQIRLVESTVEEGGKRVISSGLQTGDKIVVDGHVRLFDNAQVIIANEEEKSVSDSPKSPVIYTEDKEIIIESVPTTVLDTTIDTTEITPEEITPEVVQEEIQEIAPEVVQEEITPEEVQEIVQEEITPEAVQEIVQEEVQEPIQEENTNLDIFKNLDIPSSEALENSEAFDSQHINEVHEITQINEAPIDNAPLLQEIPSPVAEVIEPVIYEENNPHLESQELLDSILASQQEAEEENASLIEVTPIQEDIENTQENTSISNSLESELDRIKTEKNASVTTPLSGGIDLSTKTIFGDQAHLPNTQKPANAE